MPKVKLTWKDLSFLNSHTHTHRHTNVFVSKAFNCAESMLMNNEQFYSITTSL